ncbi:hypothetical protein ACOJUR_15170 [Alicyclobacillus tolerans]|uniref:hypothetical protein n=1 Tax=Alicyclobacillus tolerans TaxID=90970 RepID=UPI003B7E0507
MNFLVIFVLAVVVIGILLIFFNWRALDSNSENSQGKKENRASEAMEVENSGHAPTTTDRPPLTEEAAENLEATASFISREAPREELEPSPERKPVMSGSSDSFYRAALRSMAEQKKQQPEHIAENQTEDQQER